MRELKLGLWVAIGTGLGAAFGYALHDVITGWAIGAGLGALIAVAQYACEGRTQ